MKDHRSSPRTARDPTYVDIEDEHETKFWIEKFGCTVEQLRAAVKKVGPHFQAVRAELGRRVPMAPMCYHQSISGPTGGWVHTQ